MFLRKIHVLLSFWKNFLILILIESSLDSWIFSLESWPWFLELESWNLILEIKFPLEPWSVLDSILNSFFDSWDHHLCYHEVFLTFELCFLSSSLLSSKLFESILIHLEACFYIMLLKAWIVTTCVCLCSIILNNTIHESLRLILIHKSSHNSAPQLNFIIGIIRKLRKQKKSSTTRVLQGIDLEHVMN